MPRNQLVGGLFSTVKDSRKSAIPPNIPGRHLIVGIETLAGEEVKFGDVNPEQEAEAIAHLIDELRKIAEALGRPNCIRLAGNGSGLATRDNWHFHGMALGMNLTELAAQGLEPARLVDPEHFLVPIKPGS